MIDGDECPLMECKICKEMGHIAKNCPKRQPCKHCGGDYSNRNCPVPKKPLTRGNLSRYPTKQVKEADYGVNNTIDDNIVDEIDKQGFSINETNMIVEFSMVSAKALPGMPMNELQEQMIIDYAMQLSCKDASLTHTPTSSDTTPITLSPVKTHPKKVELVEVTDMSFYHSPRITDNFNNKKSLVEAIFIVPARNKGQVSSPFGNEVVVELLDNKFIKGIQWQEESTKKQYVTWYDQAQHATFEQDSSKGYTYIPEFGVVRITPAELFEDRPVAREVEVEIEEDKVEGGKEQVNA
jgi:hypothetical protein